MPTYTRNWCHLAFFQPSFGIDRTLAARNLASYSAPEDSISLNVVVVVVVVVVVAVVVVAHRTSRH